MKNLCFMPHNSVLIQLLISCLLFGCIQTNKLSLQEIHKPKKTYQQIAEEKLGEKVEYKLNPDKTYVLCRTVIPEPKLNPNQLIEFFVYDIQQQKIIFEDKIANAKIAWYNNTQLLIIIQKGYITNPTDTGKWSYVFDLKSKKQITPKKIQ